MIHVYGILHVLVMKASILCPSIEINRLDFLHAEYPMLALNVINSNGIFFSIMVIISFIFRGRNAQHFCTPNPFNIMKYCTCM